jgi:hypothetical protein
VQTGVADGAASALVYRRFAQQISGLVLASHCRLNLTLRVKRQAIENR